MSIISRAEAKRQNLKQYFTGEPCKHGHTVYRYTQSGACSACIRGVGNAVDVKDYLERRAATDQLVQVKFRLFRDDVELFTASAYAFGIMRFPILRKIDVYPGLLPLDTCANTGLYKFNCHLDDVAALRAVANDLCQSHKLDVEAVRQKVFAGAATYLPADSAPPINFK